jgi:hypothetical protein
MFKLNQIVIYTQNYSGLITSCSTNKEICLFSPKRCSKSINLVVFGSNIIPRGGVLYFGGVGVVSSKILSSFTSLGKLGDLVGLN